MISSHFIRWFTLSIILSFLSNCVYCQDEEALEFLKKYNQQIDPDNKLDTLKYLFRESELIAKTDLSPTGEYQSIRSEYYSTDSGVFHGLINKNTGQDMADAIVKNPLNENQFFIKSHLLLLRTDTVTNRFTMINQTDSITVIREEKNDETYHLLTFGSQSFDIIQTKRTTINKNEIDESTTDYLEFQVINDIKIPTKVKYSGKYAEATLTYSNYSFEPFDKAVFKVK